MKAPGSERVNTVQSMSNPCVIMDLQQRPSSFKYKRFKLKMEKVFPQKYRVQNLESSCQPCWVQPNFGKKNINEVTISFVSALHIWLLS